MKRDINEGYETYKHTKNAVLVDVREPEEYADGHLPEAVNIPLSVLKHFETYVADKDTPLFLYCRSGSRAIGAETILKKDGYCKITNIGGITDWTGNMEK